MPTANNKRVLVIGAGVIGLTTAVCLRRQGIGVTVVAEKFAPQVTSVVAGALWEWPPAVYRPHSDNELLQREKGWSKRSYEVFSELSHDPATGVFMRTATFYFLHPIDNDSIQVRKMNELRLTVRDFVRDPSLIVANGVNSASGMQDAYSYLAPVIDTDVYMTWLLSRARITGCEIVQCAISGVLFHHEETLKRQFQVDAIVNCAGLGSGELAGEVMYPLRGALIRVRNDGRRFPRITQAHCVAHTGSAGESEFIFIVPRGEDMLVLGGLTEPNEWSTQIGLENYEPIKKMYRRCVHFLPVLENAEIDSAEPVRVGLRPFRIGNVRLEQEAGSHIIHNFGHGGSGVTYSWGCAHEVVELTDRLWTHAG